MDEKVTCVDRWLFRYDYILNLIDLLHYIFQKYKIREIFINYDVIAKNKLNTVRAPSNYTPHS